MMWGNDFPGGLTGVGFVGAPQFQRISPLPQGFFHPGNDLKHVGIFKSNVPVEIGQQHHPAGSASGEALSAGVGIVAQGAHGGADVCGGCLGNAVVAVEHL